MSSLDPDLARLLTRIARADGGAHRRFQPMFVQQSDAPVMVNPPVEGTDELLPGPMSALDALGYLDMEPGEPGEYGPLPPSPGRSATASRQRT